MKRIQTIPLTVPAAALLVLLSSCEWKKPAAVFDPDKDLGTTPEITSIEPAGRAAPGVLSLTLHGRGFSADAARNLVYFNSTQAAVTACTDTQITVLRPNVYGDSLTVKVRVEGAYSLARFEGYGVDEAARLWGQQPRKNWVQFIAVDASENIYILNKTKDLAVIDSLQVTRAFGMRTFRQKATDMKMGPDGGVYLSALAKAELYRVAPEGGDTELYADLAAAPVGFDFDAAGAMVGAGLKTGLIVLLPDLATRTLGVFQDLDAVAVKAYRGQVYAADAKTVWRASVSADYAAAGPAEKVLDLSGTAFAASNILAFAMDEDGVLYLSVDTAEAMLVAGPGGVQAMYAGILIPNGGVLAWGSGPYLYLNMTQDGPTNDLMRIDTGKNEAPK